MAGRIRVSYLHHPFPPSIPAQLHGSSNPEEYDQKDGVPLSLSCQSRTQYFTRRGRPPAFLIPTKSKLKNVNSWGAPPKNPRFPSFTQPPLTGRKLYSTKILGHQRHACQLVHGAAQARRSKLNDQRLSTLPTAHSSGSEILPWTEAASMNKELLCSSQKNWLYLKHTEGEFKPKGTLEHNGDFSCKQIWGLAAPLT